VTNQSRDWLVRKPVQVKRVADAFITYFLSLTGLAEHTEILECLTESKKIFSALSARSSDQREQARKNEIPISVVRVSGPVQ
jgi:hypothetical protein